VKVVLTERDFIRLILGDEGRRCRQDRCLVQIPKGFRNGFDLLLSLLLAVSKRVGNSWVGLAL